MYVFHEVRTEILNLRGQIKFFKQAVSWFRLLVAGPSLRGPRFATMSVHGTLVLDKVTLEQVYFRVPQVSPISIIPPLRHTRLIPYNIVIRMVNGVGITAFKESN